MGNPEHIAILRKGVSEWNKWRRTQAEQGMFDGLLSFPPPVYRMDLGGADFSGSQLSSAELFFTDLTDTSFAGAVLTCANFGPFHAGMRSGDIVEWKGTAFSSVPAMLIRSNLSGGMLQFANFEDCPLIDVDFSHASLGSTRFLNVSLARAKGLESCKHTGPSYLDHRTLMQSGVLPIPFLRGCGLPDAFIEYLPSLLKEPIQFYSCFISYSSRDEGFVQRLYVDLQNKGIRCWYAPENLRIGDKFRQRIEDSIRVHDKLLVVLSENSIRSSWVEEEVETGLERERREGAQVLFPIRLDDAVMKTDQSWAASLRRLRHIGDLSNWKEHDPYVKALDRLVRDLKPCGNAISTT